MDNFYQPYLMTVAETRDETADVRSLRLEFQDEAARKSFRFQAGQFGLYSVFGQGECVFCIAHSAAHPEYVECSFSYRWGGKVTEALSKLSVGDTMGFRGPYGNSFPIEELQGKNLVFMGGGIGMAPIRSIFTTCLDQRDQFGKILLLNGARSVADLVYKQEMQEWMARTDITVAKTVDPGGDTPDWDGRVGLLPAVLEELAPSAKDARALLCGPPILIRFALQSLAKLGFPKEHIFTTLENRMKCGVGHCGRCNVGGFYVCKDGPVFRASDLDELPSEF
ncbi:MAG TPA: FAD/NAD(P)-binding protein [Armatimonadota bacterium]|nr:FAD/NAD(P)-binding protein [Armatimonadota bacterium]